MVAGLFLRTPLCLLLPPAYHVGSHFTPTCVPSVLVSFPTGPEAAGPKTAYCYL